MQHAAAHEALQKSADDMKLTIQLWEDKYERAMNDVYRVEGRLRK